MILFSHSGHQSIFGSNGVQHSTTAPTQNCWTKLSAYIGGRIVFQSTSREFLLLRSLLLLLPPSLPPSSNRAPTPPPSQQHDAVLWLDMGRPGTGPACLAASLPACSVCLTRSGGGDGNGKGGPACARAARPSSSLLLLCECRSHAPSHCWRAISSTLSKVRLLLLCWGSETFLVPSWHVVDGDEKPTHVLELFLPFSLNKKS